MENKKKIVINILAILIVILICIAVGIIIAYKSKQKLKDTEPLEKEYTPEIILTEELKELNIRNKYYIVKTIVENYYNSLCKLNWNNQEGINDETIENEIMFNKQRIYDGFDKNVLKRKNITLDNLKQLLGTYKDLFVDIEKVTYIESESLTTYFAQGQIIEKEDNKSEEFLLMIVVDSQNSTFNIYTQDIIENDGFDNFTKNSFKKLGYSKIEKRGNNKYTFKLIKDEEYCMNILEDYINKIKYNRSSAYNILNEEYKKKKFNSLLEYNNYIKNLNLEVVNLESYQIKNNGEKKEYICLDNWGRYYIFEETVPMKYTVILDTYTIDIPEFTEKYESSNEKEKTILNIQKFINSLNDKDYKYAYSCLADSFKNNYFKDIDTFKRYIENNFPNNFEVSYLTFEKIGEEYYTYLVKMSNGNNKISKTFIMKLGEKTNFELSFNV